MTLQERLSAVVNRAYPFMEVTLGGVTGRDTLYFRFGQGRMEAFEIERRPNMEPASDDYIIFVAGIFADATKQTALRRRDRECPRRPASELEGYLKSLKTPPVN